MRKAKGAKNVTGDFQQDNGPLHLAIRELQSTRKGPIIPFTSAAPAGHENRQSEWEPFAAQQFGSRSGVGTAING